METRGQFQAPEGQRSRDSGESRKVMGRRGGKEQGLGGKAAPSPAHSGNPGEDSVSDPKGSGSHQGGASREPSGQI